MMKIEVRHNPSEAELERLGVRGWPVWTKETSTFPWSYEEREVCFLLEGQVTVTPDDGDPVSFGAGDLVTFQKGLSCTWNVREPVRKHYVFG